MKILLCSEGSPGRCVIAFMLSKLLAPVAGQEMVLKCTYT